MLNNTHRSSDGSDHGFIDQDVQIAASPTFVDETLTGDFNLPLTTGSTIGVIYKGADRFIHDFNFGDNGTVVTAGGNIFVGKDAGNFTMGSDATQPFHASTNVGIGEDALVALTRGYQNTGIGARTLEKVTIGLSNVAIGSSALRKLIDGTRNIGIGENALFNLTNSSFNVAIGPSAGITIFDGSTPLTAATNGIFIGFNAHALSNSDTNEIVIGADAIGNGSNTATLGNDSITETHLKGGIVGYELSADPADPAEGSNVQWQSDGTGSGDDGDIMMKITAGAVTKTITLVDYSAA